MLGLLGHVREDPWDDDPALPAAEIVAPGWWPEGAWGGYRQDTVLGVLLHLFADTPLMPGS